MGLGTGATAAIIGGIGAAGSVASGVIGANAAGNAASTQANSANYAAQLQSQEAQNALNFQEQQYNQGQQNLQPWLQTGTGALSQLASLEGISPQSPSAYAAPQTANAPVPSVNTGTPGRPTAPAIGNGPQNTIARANFNGQQPPSVGPLTSGSNIAGVNPNGTPATPGSTSTPSVQNPGGPTNTVASANGFRGGPTSPLSNGGVLNPNGGQQPGQPISTLSGSPASATVPSGIDPATGFQTGASNAPGSLAQGWNQEFQAPTAAQAAQTPGYQFQLQQGEQALQNSAAAKGGLLSGNTAQALDQFGQGLASSNYQQTYNNALNQYQTAYNQFQQNQQNQFNRLGSLAGVGQTAAGQLNSAGQQAASNIGNISQTAGAQIGQSAQNAGAATASGYVGQANALGGALSGSAGSIQQGLLLNSLLGNQGYAPYTNTGGPPPG